MEPGTCSDVLKFLVSALEPKLIRGQALDALQAAASAPQTIEAATQMRDALLSSLPPSEAELLQRLLSLLCDATEAGGVGFARAGIDRRGGRARGGRVGAGGRPLAPHEREREHVGGDACIGFWRASPGRTVRGRESGTERERARASTVLAQVL